MDRLTRLKAERDDLLARDDATWTAADLERAKALPGEIAAAERGKAQTDALRAAGLGVAYHGPSLSDDEDDDPGFTHATTKSAGIPAPTPHAQNAAMFTSAFAKSVRAADATVGGHTKALVASGSIGVDYAALPITEPRPTAFVSSAIPLVHVDSPTGAFLQQKTRTNNAASVQIGAEKPTSIYGFEHVQWGVSTLAHLSEPVARQWTQDFAGLIPAVASELAYGLQLAVDDLVLNGSTDEQGIARAGLLNHPGIAETTFHTDTVTSLRWGLFELEEAGVTADTIVLSAADWLEVDLTREAADSNRFLTSNGAPINTPERRLWGTRVILSSQLAAGTAIVADFASSSAIAVREGIVVSWSEQGVYEQAGETPTIRDLHATNQTRFRAENRVALIIAQPAAIRKVKLTA